MLKTHKFNDFSHWKCYKTPEKCLSTKQLRKLGQGRGQEIKSAHHSTSSPQTIQPAAHFLSKCSRYGPGLTHSISSRAMSGFSVCSSRSATSISTSSTCHSDEARSAQRLDHIPACLFAASIPSMVRVQVFPTLQSANYDLQQRRLATQSPPVSDYSDSAL